MYIFCSKALTDAINIKKTELQKVSAKIQIDDLYAWHGHITKLDGKNTIILMNDKTMYSLIFRNKLPRSADKFSTIIKEAVPYTMEVGGFNKTEINSMHSTQYGGRKRKYGKSKNVFCNFPQREYDFEELERSGEGGYVQGSRRFMQ